MLKTLTVLITLPCVLGAVAQQEPTPANPLSQGPDTLGIVEGAVTSAATGDPVKKAVVQIHSMERNWDSATLTDIAGQFLFRDVAPGRYKVEAEGRGFLPQTYGEQTYRDGGTELRLEPGQDRKGIVFHLIPSGAISGRVYDEDGDPVMGANVSALGSGFFREKRQLFPRGESQTDERGRYRVSGILPGRCTVMAYARRRGEDRHVAYLPTYYPGTSDPNQAAWLDLEPGQEVTEIDIRLTSTRAVCVRGAVTHLVPSKNFSVPAVVLVPVRSLLPDQIIPTNLFATAMNDEGEFQVCGVPPGLYFADADYQDGERQYKGRTLVDVDSSNVSGVDIPLDTAFEIHGRVRTNLAGPFDFSKVEVWLRAADQSGGGAGGEMKPDGTFVLHDVFEGTYRIQIAGYPEKFYMKSASWGGTDVLAEGLAANKAKASETLEILLDANGGSIFGTVTRNEKLVSLANVVFIPDVARRGRDELYSLTRTDQSGRFALLGLPPGDFTLLALEKIEGDSYRDPEFLERLAAYTMEVHVEERQQQTVELKLAPSQ